MLWIKNNKKNEKEENNKVVNLYDHLSLGEIMEMFRIFNDRPVIHNGHVVGFTKE